SHRRGRRPGRTLRRSRSDHRRHSLLGRERCGARRVRGCLSTPFVSTHSPPSYEGAPMTAVIRSALTGLAAAIVLSLGTAASPGSDPSGSHEQIQPPGQTVEHVDTGQSDQLDTDAVDSYV